jgi:hypothetical protein
MCDVQPKEEGNPSSSNSNTAGDDIPLLEHGALEIAVEDTERCFISVPPLRGDLCQALAAGGARLQRVRGLAQQTT